MGVGTGKPCSWRTWRDKASRGQSSTSGGFPSGPLHPHLHELVLFRSSQSTKIHPAEVLPRRRLASVVSLLLDGSEGYPSQSMNLEYSNLMVWETSRNDVDVYVGQQNSIVSMTQRVSTTSLRLTTLFANANPMTNRLNMILLLQCPNSKEVISSIRQSVSIVLDILFPSNEITLGQRSHQLVQSRMLQSRKLSNDGCWNNMMSSTTLFYCFEDSELFW